MILLDTNVISQAASATGNAAVVDWLDRQDPQTLYLSTIAIAELRYGLALLPDGRRKAALTERIEGGVLPLFADRVLDFDLAATAPYAALRAATRSRGLAVSTSDGYIAAIAMSRGYAVATRDVAPFIAAGLKVVNPFEVTRAPA